MTLTDCASTHTSPTRKQYAIEEEDHDVFVMDEFGCALPVEEFSDSSCDGNYLLYEVSLASRNQENICSNTRSEEEMNAAETESVSSTLTAGSLEAAAENHQLPSSSVKRLVDNFSLRVDVAQEKAEKFTRRRGDALSRSVNLAQERAEAFTRTSGDVLARNVVDIAQEKAESFTKSSGNTLASSVDMAQEQAERFSRILADSITKNVDSITKSVDSAQERAEILTRIVATSVFGKAKEEAPM